MFQTREQPLSGTIISLKLALSASEKAATIQRLSHPQDPTYIDADWARFGLAFPLLVGPVVHHAPTFDSSAKYPFGGERETS